ncbi:MAG: 50S ribosomal protein L3 [Candidatus Wolfebacteria bacterium]|nr:50S ribosomal protein L3 [Candidatus Wolfebacteria bacterium]
MKFILGKKLKMSQLWKGDKVVPITVIQSGPNAIIGLRTKGKDGYEAVQVGFVGKKKRSKNSPVFRHIKEFRARTSKASDVISQLKTGDILSVDQFEEGQKIEVSGLNKGRGFQGTVKRHGFAGGPKTHGQKNRHRAPGSIGATAPQRVLPGRRMAGRMGSERVTVKNLTVAGIDKEKNQIFIKGAVPGMNGTLVEIRGN